MYLNSSVFLIVFHNNLKQNTYSDFRTDYLSFLETLRELPLVLHMSQVLETMEAWMKEHRPSSELARILESA